MQDSCKKDFGAKDEESPKEASPRQLQRKTEGGSRYEVVRYSLNDVRFCVV